MKKIRLNNTLCALVDDEDFEALSKLKWYAFPNGNSVYARHMKKGGKSLMMHREIMNVTSNNLLVDHINGNGLDNRRKNLRICSPAQNLRNVRTHKDCISGFKGVSKISSKNPRWAASIHINNRRFSIGYFDTPEDAARAYNESAKKHFGEFAKLNEVEPRFPVVSPGVQRSGNKSGFRGVSLKRPGQWQSRIYINKRVVYLGTFRSPEEAAIAYNEAAKKHYGEFAKLNDI